ncbi:MAG: tyrosine-type recombinase/integrase [Gemmatimonadaceae bacterium]
MTRTSSSRPKSVRLRQNLQGRHRLVGGPLVADANRFLDALEARGLSGRTIRAYGYDFVVLCRWLKRRGLVIRRLCATDVLNFIAAQRSRGVQPTSINRSLTSCRLLYRFCTDRDLERGPGVPRPAPYYRGRGRDRALGLHALRRPQRLKLRVRTPTRIVEPLTVQEVQHFLRGLRRYRDLAIVQLMLLCGLRSAEVLQLRCTDLVIADRQLRVQGKGNKERILPLPDIVAGSVDNYLYWERPASCSAPQLFVVLQGCRRGRAMTASGLRSLFRHRRRDQALARANPHRFRHTFGADMARAGVRLPILQRMMGHADGMTTLQYIHLSMTDVADEYRRAIAAIGSRYRR